MRRVEQNIDPVSGELFIRRVYDPPPATAEGGEEKEEAEEDEEEDEEGKEVAKTEKDEFEEDLVSLVYIDHSMWVKPP